VVATVAFAALLAVGAPAAAATPPARSAVPTGSAVTGTAPVPGPSGPAGPGSAAAVAAWVGASGEADLEALAEDFTALEQAAVAGSLPGMAAACGRLGSDVEAALGHAPIPDPLAQQSWAATLTLYDLGAHDCVAGATRIDPRLLNRASDEIIQGSDRLQRVIDRLNQIG
jgi:hypothetical protein